MATDAPVVTAGFDLPEGDAGFERFLDMYAIGSGVGLTPEQRQCLRDELAGEVSVEDLELLVNGGASDETQTAVGVAFISCDALAG